jgi:ArsR family transcriptional regulator
MVRSPLLWTAELTAPVVGTSPDRPPVAARRGSIDGFRWILAAPEPACKNASFPPTDVSMSRSARRPSSAAPAPEEPLLPVLRACADPVRLTILRLLARDAFAVAELATVLGLGQATVSHHLKQLVEAELVTARRDGTHSYYRRAPTPAAGAGAPVAATILQALDARPLPDDAATAVEHVFETRAERSRVFFERHAEDFDAARELIATPDRYLTELADLLPERGARALEVGPGLGEFLPTLAERFGTVVALDVSPLMLERARARCERAGLTHVHFEAGEPPAPDGRPRPAALAEPFDAVVIAMVLHHVPRPETLLTRSAALLAPGGVLLVAELCPHTQDWVGEACGDVWRGIDPDRLDGWAREAGLEPGPGQFLALRNGFRVQTRRYRRPSTADAATQEPRSHRTTETPR